MVMNRKLYVILSKPLNWFLSFKQHAHNNIQQNLNSFTILLLYISNTGHIILLILSFPFFFNDEIKLVIIIINYLEEKEEEEKKKEKIMFFFTVQFCTGTVLQYIFIFY